MFHVGRCGGILQPCSGITTDNPGKGKFGCVYVRIVENGLSTTKTRSAEELLVFVFQGCEAIYYYECRAFLNCSNPNTH